MSGKSAGLNVRQEPRDRRGKELITSLAGGGKEVLGGCFIALALRCCQVLSLEVSWRRSAEAVWTSRHCGS